MDNISVRGSSCWIRTSLFPSLIFRQVRVLLFCWVVGSGAAFASLDVTLVNTDSAGVQANGESIFFAISADGRYVVFSTEADNLVEDDTNGVKDIFLKDLLTGTTTRVNTSIEGGQADGASDFPDISADGRYVLFNSAAANLVAGDTNGRSDVFVKDLLTGVTTRVSENMAGVQGDSGSGRGFISADGSHAVFYSWDDNLVSGDPYKYGYILVKNRVSGELKVVNADSEGNYIDAFNHKISHDGRYVVFTYDDLVYLKDVVTGELKVASADKDGKPGYNISDDYLSIDLNADGRYVVFASESSRLVPNDTNGGHDDLGIVEYRDIFRKDTQTGTITRVNVDRDGNEVIGWAERPSISSDGRYVVFDTFANNLVAGDHDDSFDVYLKDMLTGTVVLLSPGYLQTSPSTTAVIAKDGGHVVFLSSRSDLVSGDNNDKQDIFRVSNPLYTADGDFDGDGLSDADEVALGTDFQQADSDGDGLSDGDEIGGDGFYDPGVDTDPLKADSDGDGDGDGAERGFGSDPLDAGSRLAGVLRMSTASDGGEARAASQDGSVSADGRYTVFTSAASNWVAGDGNGVSDIFLKDGLSAALTRVSLGSQAEEGNGASGEAMLSADGRYVVFSSAASNWVADGNGVTDIYLKDLSSGALSRVSTDSNGGEANAASSRPVISADGQYVAFVSAADNLVAGDGNGVADVFVKHTRTGQLSRVSADSEGRGGNGRSDGAAISADGRYVVFRSAADDLVEQDLNGVDDVFRKDLATGTLVRISEDQNGVDGNSASRDAAMSGDGRYVVFRSAADNWSGGDTNGAEDIFWKDTQTGVLVRVSLNSSGEPANGRSFNPTLSADGRYAVFMSAATNLVAGDSNGETDVFVKELQSGSVKRVNLDGSGEEANGRSYQAMVSGDGRWVVFDSVADNLVDDDGNRRRDVFKAVNGLFAADGDGDGLSDAVEAVLGTDAAQADSDGDGLSDGEEAGVDGRYDAGVDTDPLNADTDGDGAGDGNERHFGGDPLTAAVTVDHVRLSTSSAGEEGHGASRDGAINFDGRYIVFASEADDLVADDTNGVRDIFLKDSLSGELVRLSTAADGTEGNGGSFDPVISADGRYVAFESEATNLVAGDTNGVSDIFVKDVATGAVVRANLDWDGTEARPGGSYNPAISADGRYLVFSSEANNLLTDIDYEHYVGRPPVYREVFLKDLVSGMLRRVSPMSDGREGSLWSDQASVSGDGNIIAYRTNVSELVGKESEQIFIFNRAKRDNTIYPYGDTEPVSTANIRDLSNGPSDEPAVSADGRFTVFTSAATDLVAGDSNGVRDIFLREMASGRISRISVGADGEQGSADSREAAISANGRYVAFASYADNWVAGDDNGRSDIFVKDVLTGQLRLVSSNRTDVLGNRDSLRPAISGDGRYIVFDSGAKQIVAGDGNGRKDVFRVLNPLFVQDFDGDGLTDEAETFLGTDPHNPDSDEDGLTDGEETGFDGRYQAGVDTDPLNADSDGDGVNDGVEVVGGSDPLDPASTAIPRTLRASTGSDGQEANRASEAPDNSADGRYMVFSSWADNLVDDDSNEARDIFLKDLTNGLLTRMSTDTNGNQANGASISPAISADGRYVVFASYATNLVADDTNDFVDIYRKDLLTGQVIRVSVDSSGNPANGSSGTPSISADGRHVAFYSSANNLVAGDDNNETDIFWKDLATGRVVAVSTSGTGVWANNSSFSPTLSADGRYVIFVSEADNLVAGDTNNGSDIFLKDTATGGLTRVSTDSQDSQLKGTGCCRDLFISADGRYVVFYQSTGIFLKDLSTGTLTRIIENSEQLQYPYEPSISADGRYVVFAVGDRSHTGDIYVKDRLTSELSPLHTEVLGNRISRLPHISDDGRFVAYVSDASNLVLNDRNSLRDVFRTANPLFVSEESVDSDGDGVFDAAEAALGTDPHNPDSDEDGVTDGEEIQFDGHYQAGVDTDPLNPDSDGDGEADGLELTFGSDPLEGLSRLPNIVIVSTDSAGNTIGGSSNFPQLDASGRYLLFSSPVSTLVEGDTNDDTDIFVKDLYTGAIRRVSTTNTGAEGNGIFGQKAAISGDGHSVLFVSDSDNLVTHDTNDHPDIFVKDVLTDETRLVSTDSLEQQANKYSTSPHVSAGGRYAVFESLASNLVGDDTNARRDIFLKDTVTGTLTRVSTSAAGEQGNGHSRTPTMSGDGRYVFFYSGAPNLVDGDQNEAGDIFKKDRLTGEIELVSTGSDGQQGNNYSGGQVTTPDGRYVAFFSNATNFAPSDNNKTGDVFLKDTLTGRLIRISTDSAGQGADNTNYEAAISADARYVVFTSRAKNFLKNVDPNSRVIAQNIFVKEVASGLLSQVNLHDRSSAFVGFSDNATITADGRYIVYDSSRLYMAKNPLYRPDSDSDGLADWLETIIGTDPHKADTDGDGRVDGEEVGADGRYEPDVDTDPLVVDWDE